MFSGKVPAKRYNGSYFIDRDPTHFRHILTYLCDGKPGDYSCSVQPTNITLSLSQGSFPIDVSCNCRSELLREAKYFLLDGLVAYLLEVDNKCATPC